MEVGSRAQPADRSDFSALAICTVHCALAIRLHDKGDICRHGAEVSASYLDGFSGKVCDRCNEQSVAGGEVGFAAAPATIGAVVIQGRHDHAKAEHRISTSFFKAEACERVQKQHGARAAADACPAVQHQHVLGEEHARHLHQSTMLWADHAIAECML